MWCLVDPYAFQSGCMWWFLRWNSCQMVFFAKAVISSGKCGLCYWLCAKGCDGLVWLVNFQTQAISVMYCLRSVSLLVFQFSTCTLFPYNIILATFRWEHFSTSIRHQCDNSSLNLKLYVKVKRPDVSISVHQQRTKIFRILIWWTSVLQCFICITT